MDDSGPHVYETPDPYPQDIESETSLEEPISDDIVNHSFPSVRETSNVFSNYSYTPIDFDEKPNRSTLKLHLDKMQSDLERIEHFIRNSDTTGVSCEESETKELIAMVKSLQLKQAQVIGGSTKGCLKPTKTFKSLLTQLKTVESGGDDRRISLADGNDVAELARIQGMEQRISQLETTIGTSLLATDSQSTVTSPMIDAVHGLEQRLQLLSDPIPLVSQIESISTAIKHLQSQKPQSSDEISKLYRMMEHVLPIANSLPSLVNRLHSLRLLHTKAADLISSFDALNSQFNEQSDDLQNIKQEMKLVQEAVIKEIQSFEIKLIK